jgi:hypothetical protein
MKRKSLKIIALIITGVIFLCGTSFAVYYLIPVPISRIVEVENISSVTIVTYTPKTVLVEGHETIEYEKKVLQLNSSNLDSFINSLESTTFKREYGNQKYKTLNQIVIEYSHGGHIILKQESYVIYNAENAVVKNDRILLDDTLNSYFDLCRES